MRVWGAAGAQVGMTDMPRILLHNDDCAPLVDWLCAARPDAEFQTCESYAALPGALAHYRPDVVYSVRFAGTRGFPRDALFGTYAPRWIANGGAGTDHYGTWDTSKITVTNAAGVAADMMAEYIMGGFLHFTLDIPGLQRDRANTVWSATRMVVPLRGKTLVIVGLGHTGRALALKAKAFGMKVLGTRAHPQPTDNVDEVHGAGDLDGLLPRADFVAVCAPLVGSTHKLLGECEIAALKTGAVLADVSRGGVVDQTALLRALEIGQLAGAVLDVFEVEPLPQDNPLWQADNLILSPHCSSVYADWSRASFDLFLDNLDRWMEDAPLRNVVDPELGY